MVALDRGEPGALLVAAGPGPPAGPAPISLLALNGPRIPEAAGADIEHPGLERGHRTLTITRTGGKVAATPPAPRTARAIDLAIGDCTGGRYSWPGTAGGWTDTAPGGSSARLPAALGSPQPSRRIRCGTHSPLPRWDAGLPLRDVQEAASPADPRTTMRYDRARGSPDRHATYAAPP